MRLVLALVLMIFTLSVPAAAQDATTEVPWQDSITGQLEAFRTNDAAGALSFAGATFKAAYQDAAMFYAGILAAGYEPLVNSRSHSFGTFQQVSETSVMQVVNLVGPDQKLYRALYQMTAEPEGWRVAGVAMTIESGIGI